MNKPATLLHREFKNKIVEAINNSNLPAFVVASVLEGALSEVREIEEKQYEADKAAYEENEGE